MAEEKKKKKKKGGFGTWMYRIVMLLLLCVIGFRGYKVYTIWDDNHSGTVAYDDLVEDYFSHAFGENWKLVKEYLDKQIETGDEKREVRTYFGRVRKLPEFASRKFMERELAKRLAMNTPIQGTAADIIKIAMNSVSSELRLKGLESRLILQIHDELIVEGPESESGEVTEILERCMMGAAELAVDLVCDIHTGKTWYDLK